MIRVVGFDDVGSFLRRSQNWLIESEAENNLLLGITSQLRSGRHHFDEPVYLSTVEIDDQVVGCAFRTPPHGLGLTHMPREALPPLVDDVARAYDALPIVIGPESSTLPFASLWSDRNGCSWRVGMQQMVYALKHVHWPSSPPGGELRIATQRDRDLLQGWVSDFQRETHIPLGSEARAVSLIEEKSLYVWDDGGPRTMAAARGPTPNGIRIGLVFTPPNLRGHGYASVCVAALSKLQLDSGKSFCFLYTDAANPTSNRIYQQIGYEPVCDSVMCMFDDVAR